MKCNLAHPSARNDCCIGVRTSHFDVIIDCSCTIFWTGDQCENPRHPECLSEQTEEEIVICVEIAESKGKKCRCNTTGSIG